MRPFVYHDPKSIDEAISLHATYGEASRYIAGGTDVLVKIKEGKLTPDHLISLKHIPGLDQLVHDNETGELRIGALVTHRTLETAPLIRERFPIIHDAVSNIGSLQIRNVATIGGNLVNAVPSADGTIPLVALEASLEIMGAKGQRTEPLLHFFLGPGQSILEPGEVVTRIVVPSLLPRTGGAYIKFGRRAAMELPLLGVGVLLALEADMKTIARARIALGVAAPVPIRALAAEKFLTGKAVEESLLAEAGQIAADESKVRDSIRGVAWYRRDMVRIQVRRMGMRCVERIEKDES
jgi:carbon-monoxide dehydrogenase medium subunit